MLGVVSFPVSSIDFFSVKKALENNGFNVFQYNPSYLTVKKGGSTANVYSNGKATLFFHKKKSAQLFAKELSYIISLKNK